MPVVNMTYIANDIEVVSRDLIVLMVCGKNAAVVKNAAKYPKVSICMGGSDPLQFTLLFAQLGLKASLLEHRKMLHKHLAIEMV